MKKKILYFILAILSLIMGCEKIVDIDIPDSEKKIVVNGLINPDNIVRVNISRSLSVLESDNYVFLEKAKVRFFENDIEQNELVYTESGYYSLPNFYPSAGSNYRIEVESDGLQSVSAMTALKEPISFSEIDTTTILSEWGEEKLKLSFSILDPSDENFYALAIYATERVFDYYTNELLDSLYTYPIYFNFLQNGDGGIQDMLIDENASINYNQKVFFTDQLFNGKEFNIDLSLYKYGFYRQDNPTTLEIQVEHVSKEYYLYAASITKYEQNDGNPFAEPVSVYTNVSKGLGLFSAFSIASRQINMDQGANH